jgi:hypothetical protein
MSFRTAFVLAVAVSSAAAPASAIDGFAAPPPPPEEKSVATDEPVKTYYETVSDSEAVAESSLTTDAAASGGLPASLYAIEGAGGVVYRPLGNGAWEVSVEVAERPHERVDAVYDLVLALPLPLGSKAKDWRIAVKQSPSSPDALVYGGERVQLRRNVPLEQSWLPLLAGAPNGLPDLSRTGYAWTFWDAIVRYDPAAGATLRAYGTFRYRADERVVAPDAENPDNAAYLVTWIPTLEAVPPFAIRLDVTEGGQE